MASRLPSWLKGRTGVRSSPLCSTRSSSQHGAFRVRPGAIVGAVVDVPTAIAGFVCTSLFICLLFSQRLSRGNVVAAGLAAVSVAICKFLGWTNIAVPASVLVGVAAALACDALAEGRGARDAR